MKNRKGFTLIELLAIIVILAIIAVITVPIILNIIDNSRRGAATDSAYGYTDSVQKFYTSTLLDNRDLKLNGAYVVDNGKISGTGFDNVQVPTSGNVPTQGVLVYSNNKLMEGCLTINDYKVEYSDGKFGVYSDGDCGFFYDSTDDSCFAYTDNGDGTAVITSYLCGSGTENEELNPIIPLFIDGLVVTELGQSSFSNKGLTSVVIPPVTSIGTVAFQNNSLTSVKMSTGVETIGSAAFMNNQIEDLQLSDSLVTIGASAFQSNKLESITFPSSLREINLTAFLLNELEEVNFNEGLQKIGNSAFVYNSLVDVKIPSSVTQIDQSAFNSNYTLKTIEFPKSDITVGNNIVLKNHGTLESIVIGGTTYSMSNVGTGVTVGNFNISIKSVDGYTELAINHDYN